MTFSDAEIERMAFLSKLDEELWFGRFTPKGYEDAMPKLRKFAELAAEAALRLEKKS